jgi:hypothetical protein
MGTGTLDDIGTYIRNLCDGPRKIGYMLAHGNHSKVRPATKASQDDLVKLLNISNELIEEKTGHVKY